MSNTEQDKEYNGIMLLMLYVGWATLLAHVYVYCNNAFQLLGIPLGIVNRLIVSIDASTHLFSQIWAAKLVALLWLLVYIFGSKAKKNITSTWDKVYLYGIAGLLLLFGNILILKVTPRGSQLRNVSYTLTCVMGCLLVMRSGNYAHSIVGVKLIDDPLNKNNESFLQEETAITNDDSVNIPTEYYYKGKQRHGVISVPNPYRATLVLGTPGSGKSFAVVNNYIRQHIEKGFTMYVYDFKFPDLSTIAFHYLKKNAGTYQKLLGKVPPFYVINFDDPRRSHRCNPLAPEMLTSQDDANEAGNTIMVNLNKSWLQKQGDFFVESPINFVSACIWFLKLYHDNHLHESAAIQKETGREPGEAFTFCSFPHMIEFASRSYEEIIPIMLAEPELELLTRPFAAALANKSLEQLDGQIASARIPLSKVATKGIYWVMTGNDFTLDINNPDSPKLLCIGNNPVRKKTYGAAMGLYNAQLVKLVNQQRKLKSSLIIDELPTIYFPGLDNLIATGRSNKVSTLLAMQDIQQLKREYGDKDANALVATVGNVFSGAVKGETAKWLTTQFGKNVQQSQSFNFTEKETTTNMSTRLDSMIPESVIANLSQGHFVGNVSDNMGEAIGQKSFHARLIVEPGMIAELKNLEPIPINPAFEGVGDEEIAQLVDANFKRVKDDVSYIIRKELDRIRHDKDLKYLLRGLRTKNPDYLTEDDDED